MSSIEPGQEYNIKQSRHVEVITVDHATDDLVVVWHPVPQTFTAEGTTMNPRGYPSVWERDVFEKLTGWSPPDAAPTFALVSPEGDAWSFEFTRRPTTTPTDELKARHEAQRRGAYFVKYEPTEVTFYRRGDLIDVPAGAEVKHIVPPEWATFLCELPRDRLVGPSAKFAAPKFVDEEITCSACKVAWAERQNDVFAEETPFAQGLVSLPPLTEGWQDTVEEMVGLHAYVLEHGLQNPLELPNQPIERLRYLRDNHIAEVKEVVDAGRPGDIVCAVCRLELASMESSAEEALLAGRHVTLPVTESSDDSLDAAEAQIQVIKGSTVTKLTAAAQSFLRSVLSENRALAFLSVQSQEFVVRLNLALHRHTDTPASWQRVERDDIRQTITKWLHGLEGAPRACTCDHEVGIRDTHRSDCPQYVEPF